MNAWLIASIALMPPFGLAIVLAMRNAANQRLASVQLAGGLTTLILAAMTFAFDQPSFIDLALCLALVSVPGTLLLAMFMERFL